MGVDYYNCDYCKEIFSDCEDYGICESCYSRWCSDCERYGNCKSFIFEGKQRCGFCWKDAPRDIKKGLLLDFALEKLCTTQEVLEKEFREQAGSEYREIRDTFYCTQCEPGECASKECERVAIPCDVDDPNEEHQHCGYCCVSQINFQGLGDDESCTSCRRWNFRRLAILLLGIRQFRPKSGLLTISKDVFRFIFLPNFKQ